MSDGADTSKINNFKDELPHLNSIFMDIPFPEESFQFDSVLNRNSAIFWKPYYDLLSKYYKMIPDSIMVQARINELDYALNQFGTGLTGQMYAMFWLMLIQEKRTLDEHLFTWAKQHITNPVLLGYLLEENIEMHKEENSNSAFAAGSRFIDSISAIEDSEAFFL